jgi:colicin import membrane protein
VAVPWKLPFNLAVFFHILVLAGAVLLPQYLPKKPIIPESLSVNLVSLPRAVTPPAPTQQKVVPKKTTTTVTIPKLQQRQSRKTAPIATPVKTEPVPVAAPTKVVSIKPLKRKVKKKVPPASNMASTQRRLDDARNRALLESQRQQLIQEAQRQQDLAVAEDAVANEAVQALRRMLQTDALASSSSPTDPPYSQANGSSGNIIKDQYNAAINGILMENWALPDIKPWGSDLMAVVIIDIAKNGHIINHRFEKRSGDRVFDQFVSRTIQESNPLLPIPAAMRISQYSIGLRFRPGQIQ